MGKKLLFFISIGMLLSGLVRAQDISTSISSFTPKTDTVTRRDITDVFKSLFKSSNKPRAEKTNSKVYFSFLPTASGMADGSGKAFITTTTASFYTGNPDSTNLSNLSFTPYANFKGRFGLPLRSSIWLKNNRWYIAGDTRLMVYPQDTWGLGGGQPDESHMKLDYKYIRFYQSILRRIKPYFFAGMGYAMDYQIGITTPQNVASLKQFSGYEFGTKNGQSSFSSGITVNLLYDTRNNSINPLPGCYANLVYRLNSPALGSNREWHSLYADLRKYVSLTHTRQQNTLAFWTYYWTTLDKGAPYLNLPSIGWDFYNRSGRGIQQNRYRGESLWYSEAEYRRDITRDGLLGFVLFANVTSVTEPNKHSFRYFHPAGGGGLRIKFNKASNTNIALDYGMSQGFSCFSLNLGEAF